jgi:hypothetical protein
MTAYRPLHASDVEVGEPQPSLLTPVAEFFRRALRMPWRRPAVPAAIATAGAATTLLTPPDGQPVLRDRMLSEVRAEHDAMSPAAAHAQAMHEASEPYLPAVPASRAVTPVHAGRAPWTGAQPVLDDEALAELDRRAWVLSQLPANPARVTAGDMRRAIDSLRAMPAYGQAPVARVQEAERLAGAMRP